MSKQANAAIVGRARMVQASLAFTEGTPYEATPDERKLLTRYVTGELSIQQVVELLQQVPHTAVHNA